jgi:hypothetical protein
MRILYTGRARNDLDIALEWYECQRRGDPTLLLYVFSRLFLIFARKQSVSISVKYNSRTTS